MVGTAVYVDTSALVKLVVPEAESAALLPYLADYPVRATSVIAQIELGRALLRAGVDVPGRVRDVLASVVLLALDLPIIERAAQVEPATLRSLDAIHLCSAMALGSDLATLVTYDRRLADAAKRLGVAVASPS